MIQSQVPGTVLCGGFLVIKPTTYIARGFFLDTTPHKDQMKLWRVVMPLHHPIPHLSLTHSKLIQGDHIGLVYIDKKAYKQSAAIVLEKISPHVEPLRQLREPRDFLKYISWMSGNRMLNIRTDFGLTHYLLGNTQEALKIFREIDIDLNNYQEIVQTHTRPLIRLILNQLETDPAGLRDMIKGWRDKNIEDIGLAASCVMSPSLSVVR